METGLQIVQCMVRCGRVVGCSIVPCHRGVQKVNNPRANKVRVSTFGLSLALAGNQYSRRPTFYVFSIPYYSVKTHRMAFKLVSLN